MPALGLNVGWHGLTTASSISDIKKLFTDKQMPAIKKESILMACIPKVKPNPCLNLSISEACIMLTFHLINDAYNSSKRKDNKYEANFTADIYSKLINLGHEPDGQILLELVKLCIPRCYLNMRHKGVIPREMVGIIKRIVKSFES
jgi:hypothetical protein